VKLGLWLGTLQGVPDPQAGIELAVEAERLGFDSVWTAEAWGFDAVTPLAWVGARTERMRLGTGVMQIPGRTPVNAAMTAATIDRLSGGRAVLGLGTSGPQVVEGWHGEPWGRPLEKLREYVEIVRSVLGREVVEHHGAHYDIPYGGAGATGAGKPLRLGVRPLRADVPIVLATIAPKAVELTFEVADGWLPVWLSPDSARAVFPLDRSRPGFEIFCGVRAAVTDDIPAGLASLKPHYGFYAGGMGSRGRNFYNDLMSQLGYADAARAIQDAFLDGRPRDAYALVPDAFVDEVALVGPPARIRARLAAWRESGVTTLLLAAEDAAAMRTLAQLIL
jgi:F420-dependent oxidoreductase-like protein